MICDYKVKEGDELPPFQDGGCPDVKRIRLDRKG